MPPRDMAYLVDILQAARHISSAVTAVTEAEFVRDWMRQAAVMHQFMIIGEAVKRLSEECRNAQPAIAWRQLAGLRDVLIHSYDVIALPRIWRYAVDDIPSLITQLEQILPESAPDESE